MKAENIENVINKLIESDNHAILINGKWGIGKTYRVQKFIEKAKQNKNLKIGYVTMFGKKTLDEIHTELYQEFNRSSKIVNTVSSVVSLVNINVSMPIVASVSIDGEKTASLLKKTNECFTKKHIKHNEKTYLIIIDDFERKSDCIEVNDMLGYINNLIIRGFKVVVLANLNQNQDSKSSEEKNKIQLGEYEEKVFDRIYEITDTAYEIINEIFGENNKYLDSQLLKEFDSNLRMAIKINNLFNQLKLYINRKDYQEVNYYLIMRCVVYIVIDSFTDKYKKEYEQHFSNKDIYKFLSNDFINRITTYDPSTFKFGKYLRAIQLIFSEEDYSLIDSLFYNNKKDSLFNSCFYYSDKNKVVQIKKQMEYILELTEVDSKTKNIVEQFVKDWFTCANCIDLSFLDKEQIYKKLNELDISLLPYSKDEKDYACFYTGYEKYKKEYIIKSISENILSDDINLNRNAYNDIIESKEQYGNIIDMNKIKQELIENDFLLRNTLEDITENDWEMNHFICKTISEQLPEFKEDLTICLKNIIKDNPDDKSGNDRVNFLLRTYLES